ncbi:hypothetical protein LTR91_021752 [Friedmanniomyces endolithicus]|uniref:Grh/CP2 DB domain-containing protein n=2 Tax=Dothideomycetidae TaxID=451867 RepID=A0AAN6HC28_9PEZI|nr:hypothetical protein LTR91_021752 [Friedmanniomyces endolithicus]KAK0986849.1 hypothetical protein LTS01_009793 [Friedmanniomyces endolithicus]KAK1048076.1 hypothetical protein LTS16_004598 [Friedmanniomyces endolithicus]
MAIDRQSQKPTDDLYKNFKANFTSFHHGSVVASAPGQVATSLADVADMRLHRSIEPQQHDLKDSDPTPRGSNEPWNFGTSGLTPSAMDPNSQSFSMFANQMPAYYTPTPGGTNTIFHHQAGDLHTPNYGFGLNTPLSLPTSEGALHAGHQAAAFHDFHGQQQLMQHPSFHDVDPFQMHQQHGFPPHHFSHHSSLEAIESALGESPTDDLGMDQSIQHQHPSADMGFHPHSMHRAMQPPPVHPSGDKFRYHVTMNAPTAMIKHSDEIPVTYLNKGQAYTLNVVDTHNRQPAGPARYRTFVRVSFEDEMQRLKPAGCWQLWKEGRGTNEAHQRGGRLQAVEYVEAGPLGNAEDPSKPRIELESASFDGFCVLWSPPAGTAECPISVRFNFLSTDFSHSKGVKGIPVRLCTKTELLAGPNAEPSPSNAPEVCYGRVMLFRDHGAERKLSNDVAHVKKTIDKLNQQIAQIESGMRDLGKRKRPSVAKGSGDDRPGKVQKHRRTWSLSSVTSNGGRGSAEEDLHMKLMTLQDMFTSTRPVSVLYLHGEDSDDPDLYPVKLTGEPISLVRNDTTESSGWERQSAQTGPPSTLVSPSPSSHSVAGPDRRDSNLQQPTPFGGPSRVNSNEWRSNPQTALVDIKTVQPQQLGSPPETQPVKIQTRSSSSGWVEALGVDPSYQAPSERPIKPVACFYVQPRVSGRSPTDNLHRAIYLMQRTLKDFTNALAVKCDIEPTTVLRTVHISRQGLHILFDDDCLRELPEGQDMTAEFHEIQPASPSRMKREWDAGATDLQCDGELLTTQTTSATGYELRLLF